MESEENWDDVDTSTADPVEIVEVVKGYSTFDSFVKVREQNKCFAHALIIIFIYY